MSCQHTVRGRNCRPTGVQKGRIGTRLLLGLLVLRDYLSLALALNLVLRLLRLLRRAGFYGVWAVLLHATQLLTLVDFSLQTLHLMSLLRPLLLHLGDALLQLCVLRLKSSYFFVAFRIALLQVLGRLENLLGFDLVPFEVLLKLCVLLAESHDHSDVVGLDLGQASEDRHSHL